MAPQVGANGRKLASVVRTFHIPLGSSAAEASGQ